MYQLSRSKRDVQNAFSGVGHKDNIDYSIPDDSTVVKQSRRMRKLQEPKIEISKPGSKPVSQESQEEPEKPVESIWKPIQSPFSEYKSSPEKPVESIWKPIQFPFSESSKKNQDVPEEEVKEEKDTEGQEEVEKEEEEVEEDTEGQKEVEEEVEEDTESQEEEIEEEKEKEEVEDTEGQQDGQEEEIPDDESIEKEPESIENNEEESRKPEPLENPVTYEYLGESYYLDNLKFLQKSYDIPPGDYSENICIYKCIRQGQYPFLLFLTVYDKSKKSLVFPSAPELVKIEEETPDDEIEKLVIEPFKSTLFDIFPPSESKPLDIESEQVVDVYSPELFNGFFMTEENLWLTYDATRIGVEPAEDKEYFWVTPYEVLVLYQLRNINIDDSVISFFKTVATSQSTGIDQSFYQLKRVSDNSILPSPYVLFLCSPSSSGFFGVSDNFENVEQTTDDNVDLLVPSIKHDKIGNFPLFSSLPIDAVVPKIKRFACFVDIDEKPYLLFDNPGELDHLYDLLETRKFSSISFMFNGKQYWSIKSPLDFTEIYDDLDRMIPYDGPFENAVKELNETNIQREGSNLDGFSNEEDEINEDISVYDSDEGSNDEEENMGEEKGDEKGEEKGE